MRARLLLGLALAAGAGCSSNKFAPVSGVVLMDGKPLAGATVSFMLIEEKRKNVEAPPAATGKTNEKGEYTLTAVTGQPGGPVGKNRVTITLLENKAGDGDARPPRGGWPIKETVPDKYNEKSELTFDVPSGGTTSANFDLKK